MIGCVTEQGRAASDKAAGPPGVRHADQQGPLAGGTLAEFRLRGTDSPLQGPTNETVSGSVVVRQLDFSGASDHGNLGQLGARRPSGVPGQVPGHTAPSGYGQQFLVNAPRDLGPMPAPPAPRGAA